MYTVHILLRVCSDLVLENFTHIIQGYIVGTTAWVHVSEAIWKNGWHGGGNMIT